MMETQFIIDAHGKKMAAIVPFDEWERTEKAREILEHVYLSEIINERRSSKASTIAVISDWFEGKPKIFQLAGALNQATCRSARGVKAKRVLPGFISL
ncbi:MAG: hypothetical protein V2B19_05735 [Pseudomonadota bacterium]